MKSIQNKNMINSGTINIVCIKIYSKEFLSKILYTFQRVTVLTIVYHLLEGIVDKGFSGQKLLL